MNEKIYKFCKKYVSEIFGLCCLLFSFIPESIFGKIILVKCFSLDINIILARLLILFALVFFYYLWKHNRTSISIEGENYILTVEYGDLFKVKGCKKVIAFDECFTTTVGNRPCDINAKSVCGQYLSKNKINEQEMEELIRKAALKSLNSKSAYDHKVRYKSGSIVPNGDDLLLAFARLDKNGLGILSQEEYLDCLFLLWKEINRYHGEMDVCIPVLCSGVTRMGDKPPTQQELLDIMITTYKLSAHKLKRPNRIRIICCKKEGFSLSNIGETI